MKTLTVKETRRLLKQIAAESPDKVVSTCRYVHNKRPSCLVGHVLARSGADLSKIVGVKVKKNSDDETGYLNKTTIDDFPEDMFKLIGVKPTQKSIEVLQIAQNEQDGGWSWRWATNRALAQ